MQVATGIVVDGKVVIEGLELPEGETVVVLTREPEGEVHLSPEEGAELLEAIAEADRGATISAEELLARLDRHDLRELVGRIPNDDKPEVVDWGSPVGREAW